MSRITKKYKLAAFIKTPFLLLVSGASMNLSASDKVGPLSDLLTPLKIEKKESHIFNYGFEELDENSDIQHICKYLVEFSKKGGTCNFNTAAKIVHDEYQGNVLRIFQDKVLNGSQFLFQLQTPIMAGEDELYISYWIRFSDNFDLGKGGKLPGGLYGVVSDKPYPSGGNVIEENSGFSARVMFYTRGFDGKKQKVDRFPHLYSYIYHQDMKGKYGDRQGLNWQGLPLDFFRTTKNSAHAQKSESKTVFHKPGYLFVMRLKLNEPEINNGLIQIFLNGEKVLENNQYIFSSSGETKINRATFSFFFGGDDSWLPRKKQTSRGYLEIDNIILSREKLRLHDKN